MTDTQIGDGGWDNQRIIEVLMECGTNDVHTCAAMTWMRDELVETIAELTDKLNSAEAQLTAMRQQGHWPVPPVSGAGLSMSEDMVRDAIEDTVWDDVERRRVEGEGA